MFPVAKAETNDRSQVPEDNMIEGETANAILPDFSATEMLEDLIENEHFNKAVKPRLPLRRYGEPEDFGGIAVYLMSDASSYHIADCIVIDGGFAAA